MQAGQRVREYALVQKVGEGGMAEVWLAQHIHLDKMVALKVMTAGGSGTEFGDRFIKEAKAMARLQHPHILSATEFFVEEGVYILVMPYIDGGSLEDRIIEARGPLPLEFVLPFSAQVLSALDYAHQMGVIHRDVKPTNILIDSRAQAYLADFGIALMVGEDRKTRTGTSIGTPHYMSPEQIMRPKVMDHRADVYSFGCVLYEMLTGITPFNAPDDSGDADFHVKGAHIQQAVPDPCSINPALPEPLGAILLKVLMKEPDDRFQSCAELARALEACEHGMDWSTMEVSQASHAIQVSQQPMVARRAHTVIEDNDPYQSTGLKTEPLSPLETRPKSWFGMGQTLGLVGLLLVLLLGGGIYFISTGLEREFDAAIAKSNLVGGSASAYSIYQKAMTEKGAESGVVKDMAKRSYPVLNTKSQAAFDYFYRESELPEGMSWNDLSRIRDWMYQIQPDQDNRAYNDYAAARVYMERKDLTSALQRMHSALSSKPNWVLAINGLGRIYYQKLDKATAYAYYERAYQVDPNWAYSVFNLANCVAEVLRDSSRTESLYREAIRLAPDRPSFRFVLGNFYFGKGRPYYDQACVEYRACLSLPNNGNRLLSPQAEQT
ncbi:MAG: protein kinase, partial [bacterium]